MSTDTKATLTWWVDTLFKLGTPLLLAALFYLNSRFATHEEVAAVVARVGANETTLRVMAEQNKINERQDEQLRDHEGRLRTAERVVSRSSGP